MNFSGVLQYVNLYGLAILLVIMVPNIIYAGKYPENFENLWHNKFVEMLEQIGRFGCFGFMIVILPWFKFGFASGKIFAAYLIADGILLFLYCAVWVIYFNKNTLFRAIALSVLPSLLFLTSGILTAYLPLAVSACIFAPCHVLISVKNCILQNK